MFRFFRGNSGKEDKVSGGLLENYIRNYIRRAHNAGWYIRPSEVVGIAVVSGAVGAGFGMFLGNEYVSLAGLSLGYYMPQLILASMEKKRRDAITLQLESAMNSISSAMDVVGNVMDAWKTSIPVMESPIKDEFVRVVQEVESGVPLEKALVDMEDRVKKKELAMFNRVTVIAEEAGGKTGAIMQKCARLIAENRIQKAELEAELVQVRQDTRMMFGVFLTILSAFRVMGSSLFTFYQTFYGKIVMFALIGMALFIVFLADKSTKVKELE
ncbi:type II secretion system F family protein [Desulfurispora thermophila]|uniref:type II secretion system F family protein n=1 Tax=Desulfurispora thermophila TaxID=265470 RepID=UPI00146131BD|nr:type II secretion system F family protein [Desulfurispora thermophila]